MSKPRRRGTLTTPLDENGCSSSCAGIEVRDTDPADWDAALAERDQYREALQAIIARDPDRPGPKAAAMVTTSTMVAIAKQALEPKQ